MTMLVVLLLVLTLSVFMTPSDEVNAGFTVKVMNKPLTYEIGSIHQLSNAVPYIGSPYLKNIARTVLFMNEKKETFRSFADDNEDEHTNSPLLDFTYKNIGSRNKSRDNCFTGVNVATTKRLLI